MTDIAERAEREIKELHVFFEDWFAAHVPDGDEHFDRAASAMDEAFMLISPRGLVDDRSSILQSIRAGHGKRPDMKLWTDDISCRWESDGACLMQYREHQTTAGETTVRLSSAMFVEADGPPNGLRWLHVHETWLG